MPVLNDDQRDAIAEIMNIGMGRAIASLSQMVEQEVHLSVPYVDLLDRSAVRDQYLRQGLDNIAAVRQGFTGPFEGQSLLLFPEAESLELVRALVRDSMPLDEITEMAQEALAEVGNIVLNACLASIANLLEEEICSSLPVFERGTCDEVLGSDSEETSVLFLRIDFSLSSQQINGFVAFLIDVASIEAFKARVDALLAQM